MRRPRPRRFVLAASVAVAAALIGAAFAARNLVSSQEGSGVVDFERLTAVPFTGYPSTVAPPDFTRLPTCQAPPTERPDPNAPSLSCRYSGSEPPPGAIATAAPEDLPDTTAIAGELPAGWVLLDNRVFRYTLAIPPGWYSDMRPEGGEFRVFDDVLTARIVGKGADYVPGGVAGHFSARLLVTNAPFLPVVEEHLQSPNTSFGDVLGSVWDEGPGEGSAAAVVAAFARNEVVYEIRFDVIDGGRPADAVSSDLETITAVLETIRPY